MTREEAIDLLDNLIGMVEDNHSSDYDTALQMGIKSLSQEPTNVIATGDGAYYKIKACEDANANQHNSNALNDVGQHTNALEGDAISRQDDRGVSLKSVKHALYDVCLHEDNMALFSKLLDRVNKARDWEEYQAIKQESCEDAISRQAVLNGLASIAKAKAKSDAQKSLMGRVMFFTEQLPSVKPQEPKTGHWIEEDMFDGDVAYRCSECNELFWIEDGTPKDNGYNFCPKCGKRMVEPQESEEV